MVNQENTQRSNNHMPPNPDNAIIPAGPPPSQPSPHATRPIAMAISRATRCCRPTSAHIPETSRCGWQQAQPFAGPSGRVLPTGSSSCNVLLRIILWLAAGLGAGGWRFARVRFVDAGWIQGRAPRDLLFFASSKALHATQLLWTFRHSDPATFDLPLRETDGHVELLLRPAAFRANMVLRRTR